MTISLYSHQQEALDKLRSGSILCGGVGSGKSRTALAYYYCKECGGEIGDRVLEPMTKPKDLYIITTARKRDTCEWDLECGYFLLSKDRDKSLYGEKVTIDSWNNIKKYSEVSDAFFIFDEQRVVGSGTWVKSFIKIAKRNRWILLSATPGDTWSDYIPVFVANGFYRNRTEFLREHVVFSRFSKYPKIERYIGCQKLEHLRKRIVVNMPFEKHTKRHYNDIFVDYDESLMNRICKNRWNIYEEKPIRNAGEACLLMRKVANSDISRINAVLSILKDHPKSIIFYNFDYELESLRKMCEDNHILWSEWNGHIHEALLDSDQWVYLVQYTAGAEGWNCITTDTVIFFSLNYSYKIMEQSAGRIDRMNTPYFDLYYYRIRSKSPIDNGIFRALGQKKNFNEKAFIDSINSQ